MRLSTWSDMVAHVGPAGSGKPVRNVGVCNFSERQLKELLSYCKDNNLHKPAVVQNECHPLLQASLTFKSLLDHLDTFFDAYSINFTHRNNTHLILLIHFVIHLI